MNKSKLKIFIMIFVLIYLVYCINTFCALVSSNDGSSFITKAEFDTLKSSFQAQIDTYNQAIDSKIDEAIASYLKGIVISNESELITDFNNIKPDGATTAGLYWSSKTDGAYNTKTNYQVRWAMSLQGYECGASWKDSAGSSSGTGSSYNLGLQHGNWQQNTSYNNVNDGYIHILVSNDGSAINKLEQKAYYVTGNAHVVFGWNWKREGSNKTIDLTSNCLDTSSTAREGNLKSANNVTTPWGEGWTYDQGIYGYCVSSTTLFGEYEKDSTKNMCIYPLSTANESYDNLSTKNLNWANTTTAGVNSAWGLSWSYATNASAKTSRLADVKLPKDATIDVFDQIAAKNLKWDVLNSRCDKQAEIQKGVFLVGISNKGDLDIKYQLGSKGWVFFWKGTNPDIKWGGGRTSETDTSWKVTSNSHYINSTSEQTFTITNLNINDNIWVMYIPDSSTEQKLTINKLIFTTK